MLSIKLIGFYTISCFMVYCTQDVAVSTRDFEGALPGMTHLFAAAKNHHLFLPGIGEVAGSNVGEEEVAGSNVDKPHPTDCIDVENTSILAKERRVSKMQLMASQKAVLQEAEKSKQAQELKQLKHNKTKIAKRSSLPPRGEAYTGDNAHLQPRLPQRQHSYEPMNSSLSSQRKHLSSQTKPISLAHGEQIYNRLDSRGYQGTPSHEHPMQTRPSPQDFYDQMPRKQLYAQPPYERPLLPPYKQPIQQPQQPLQQLPQQPLQQLLQPPPDYQVHRGLSKGSTVQLVTFGVADQPLRYGVIHWVGDITGVKGTVAGIELV